MMKEIVRAVETGVLAQIGLLAFVVAFGLMVLYAFTRTRAQREAGKALPLHDLPSPEDAHLAAPTASNGTPDPA